MHRNPPGKKTGLSGKNTHKATAGSVHKVAAKAIKTSKAKGRSGLTKVNKIAGPKKTTSLVHKTRN